MRDALLFSRSRFSDSSAMATPRVLSGVWLAVVLAAVAADVDLGPHALYDETEVRVGARIWRGGAGVQDSINLGPVQIVSGP